MSSGTRALTSNLQAEYNRISAEYSNCEGMHIELVRGEVGFLSRLLSSVTSENYYGQRKPQLRDLVSLVSRVHLAARELSKKICEERVVNSRYQGTLYDTFEKCQVIINSSQRLASKMISCASAEEIYKKMCRLILSIPSSESSISSISAILGSRGARNFLENKRTEIFNDYTNHLKEYRDFVKNEAIHLSSKPAHVTLDDYEVKRENRLKGLAERVKKLLSSTKYYEEVTKCEKSPNSHYSDELSDIQEKFSKLVDSQRQLLSNLLAQSGLAKVIFESINKDPSGELAQYVSAESRAAS